MLGTTTFKSVVIQFLNVISKQPTRDICGNQAMFDRENS